MTDWAIRILLALRIEAAAEWKQRQACITTVKADDRQPILRHQTVERSKRSGSRRCRRLIADHGGVAREVVEGVVGIQCNAQGGRQIICAESARFRPLEGPGEDAKSLHVGARKDGRNRTRGAPGSKAQSRMLKPRFSRNR